MKRANDSLDNDVCNSGSFSCQILNQNSNLGFDFGTQPIELFLTELELIKGTCVIT